MKLSNSVLAALIVSGAIASGASAQVPALSRTALVDGKTKITIVGDPRTQANVETSALNSPVVKSYKANKCGLIKITNADIFAGDGTYLNNAGAAVTINPANALAQQTPQAIPVCNPTTGQLSFDLSANPELAVHNGLLKLNETDVILYAPEITDRIVDFTFNDAAAKAKYVTLNGCGIGTINVTGVGTTGMDGIISVNGSQGTGIVDLPVVQYGLKCNSGVILGAAGDFAVAPPTNFKNDRGDLFFKGSAANQEITVSIAGLPTTKSVTSDRCGGVTVGSASSPQTGDFTIDGDTITPSSLAVGLKPSCKKSATTGLYAYDVAPTSNFKTSAGQVFVKSSTASPTGFGDRRILTINLGSQSSKVLKANQCGIAKLSNSSTNPFSATTTFTSSVNATTETVGALPVQDVACANVGDKTTPNYKLFSPLN